MTSLYLFAIFSCLLLSITAVHVRKNQIDMTQEEIERFVNAVLTLKANGIYDQFVRVHGLAFRHNREPIPTVVECSFNPDAINDPHCFDWAHGGPQFLPWHRQYLIQFEQALQQVDPRVTLPYWNWGVDNSTDPTVNHLFSDYFMGGSGNPQEHYYVTSGPFANWPILWINASPVLTRNFSQAIYLPRDSQVQDLMSLYPYDAEPYVGGNATNVAPTFRKSLEGFPPLPEWQKIHTRGGFMHNNVHMWVGGDMTYSTSPNDPLFFLHHCYIDYIWSKWMLENPDQARYLPVSGGSYGINIGDSLSPWDGVYNNDNYQFYYEFSNAIPENKIVTIAEVCVPDEDLGYVYEGLLNYYKF